MLKQKKKNIKPTATSRKYKAISAFPPALAPNIAAIQQKII
jgi:hypothetical protein